MEYFDYFSLKRFSPNRTQSGSAIKYPFLPRGWILEKLLKRDSLLGLFKHCSTMSFTFFFASILTHPKLIIFQKLELIFLRRSYFMVKLKILNKKSTNKLVLFGLKINWKKRKSNMNIFSQNGSYFIISE
jgi:hypothetical protein